MKKPTLANRFHYDEQGRGIYPLPFNKKEIEKWPRCQECGATGRKLVFFDSDLDQVCWSCFKLLQKWEEAS